MNDIVDRAHQVIRDLEGDSRYFDAEFVKELLRHYLVQKEACSARGDAVKAHERATKQMEKQRDYYKQIVKWYRRNRGDNVDKGGLN
jgi:hypothetical protein